MNSSEQECFAESFSHQFLVPRLWFLKLVSTGFPIVSFESLNILPIIPFLLVRGGHPATQPSWENCFLASSLPFNILYIADAEKSRN
jgi:hypothetical protein